jgi:hypothetical protein
LNLTQGIPNYKNIVNDDKIPFDKGNCGRMDIIGGKALGGEIKVLVDWGGAN